MYNTLTGFRENVDVAGAQKICFFSIIGLEAMRTREGVSKSLLTM
jgi:hypothetical protein